MIWSYFRDKILKSGRDATRRDDDDDDGRTDIKVEIFMYVDYLIQST